jgi:hypothetical protein
MAESRQLDIFGKSWRRPEVPAPKHQMELFAGAAWTWAADGWARERGLTVTACRIDQRFEVGGRWYAMEWAPESDECRDRGTWEVRTVEE